MAHLLRPARIHLSRKTILSVSFSLSEFFGMLSIAPWQGLVVGRFPTSVQVVAQVLRFWFYSTLNSDPRVVAPRYVCKSRFERDSPPLFPAAGLLVPSPTPLQQTRDAPTATHPTVDRARADVAPTFPPESARQLVVSQGCTYRFISRGCI